MSRLASSQIRLINLCLLHKVEPDIALSLLAMEAFAMHDFDQLDLCVKMGEAQGFSGK